jgi:predicted nucleic acid-binding protein
VIEAIVLDTGPLGQLTHPRCNPQLTDLFQKLLRAGTTVFVPEIADYELRRNLILEGKVKSIRRLDQIEGLVEYIPLDTRMMRRAAQLWADMRKRGKPSADIKALDGDVILVAQAERVNAPILTDNVGHLAQVWSTLDWDALP